MTTGQLAGLVAVLIDDEGRYKQLSRTHLTVIEGALARVIWMCETELERRDKAES